MSEPIKCYGAVYGVKTLVDHGIRVSIDLPETAIMQAAMFMECQRIGVVLDIECTPKDQTVGDNSHDSKQGRPAQKSLRGQ
jgi:hypothetical protein